ncbi:hypothetical protein LIER_30530 [Lithospermum erythrorhizon]|uniref:Flotillin-like n=1 Tax=Lithospermum erythrorhizon TaxID=34254 RepID=A0AAV3RMZ9_LITER
MENVEPNLPLFFNMHSTLHSGFLTFFSSLSNYNIFVEDKPDKDYKVFYEEGVLIHAGIIRSKEFDSSVEPPVTWEKVLKAALSSVEPRKVSFSTMTWKRVPLFKKAKMVTKIVPEFATASTTVIPIAESATTVRKKDRLQLLLLGQFSQRGPRHWLIDRQYSHRIIVTASKGKEVDTDPKITTSYSANYLKLQYTLPGVLESTRTGKEKGELLRFQENAYNDKKTAIEQALAEIAKCKDLEAQNVKLKGEKIDLSLQVSRLQLSLSQETKRAQEAERKVLLAQEFAGKAIEEYRASKAYQEDLGAEAAYCLCRFVKTFKDINPSMVAHYQEFTSEYPSHWFTSLDVNASYPPWKVKTMAFILKVKIRPKFRSFRATLTL